MGERDYLRKKGVSATCFFVFWLLCVGAQRIEDPSRDDRFLSCVAANRCGLQNKCSYALKGETGSKTRNGTANDPFVIAGHLFVARNRYDADLVFYWDVLGEKQDSGKNPNDRYHRLPVQSGMFKHFDSGHTGEHTIRLYVLKNQTEGRLGPGSAATQLELVQTMIARNAECTKLQTCRFFDAICFSNEKDDVACEKYKRVCWRESDTSSLGKDTCLRECFYTYWPSEYENLPEFDSERVLSWINKGGGAKGGNLDGTCDDGAILGLSLVLFVSLLGNALALYLAWALRNQMKGKPFFGCCAVDDVFDDVGGDAEDY